MIKASGNYSTAVPLSILRVDEEEAQPEQVLIHFNTGDAIGGKEEKGR